MSGLGTPGSLVSEVEMEVFLRERGEGMADVERKRKTTFQEKEDDFSGEGRRLAHLERLRCLSCS